LVKKVKAEFALSGEWRRGSIRVLQEEQVHEISFNEAALIVAAGSIQCYNFYIGFRSRAEDSFI
jgi:hypothetical protein